jgi:hypothetical protein
MKNALRVAAAVAALSLATAANAAIVPITVVLNGTSTGTITFPTAGTDYATFTIPTGYHYDVSFMQGIFTLANSGGAGPESFKLTTSGPGTVDFSLTTSAVPEPVTWAMMLLGFAGLGIVGYGRRSLSSPRGASGDVGVA